MTISKIETDPETLSNLSIEELREQLHVHEKLYTEFQEFIDRKKAWNENIDADVELSYRVLEHEYWDIKAELERRQGGE
jgi:hypothetical protein